MVKAMPHSLKDGGNAGPTGLAFLAALFDFTAGCETAGFAIVTSLLLGKRFTGEPAVTAFFVAMSQNPDFGLRPRRDVWWSLAQGLHFQVKIR